MESSFMMGWLSNQESHIIKTLYNNYHSSIHEMDVTVLLFNMCKRSSILVQYTCWKNIQKSHNQIKMAVNCCEISWRNVLKLYRTDLRSWIRTLWILFLFLHFVTLVNSELTYDLREEQVTGTYVGNVKQSMMLQGQLNPDDAENMNLQ